MRATRALFALWVLAGLALGVVLMIRHAIALPGVAPGDARLAAGLRALRPASGRWQAAHFLYAECRCSQRIVDHLLAPARPRDLAEAVILVGTTGHEERLRRAGFEVRSVTRAALVEQYGVEGAPLLVVAEPAGRVRYAGGYTTTRQGADVRDLAIIAELRRGAEPPPLAVLGCAVSDRLKAWLTPVEI